ncbi:MAG: hypothetical protein JSV86_03080 [Gemmatimonadota bacterium]|nr:MAG: hypothetical protein JSV86_03080 [Gemmatimonadota bacterium]
METETQIGLAIAGISFAIYIPCLWLAMKITRVGGNWLGVLLASAGSFAAAVLAGYFLGPIVGLLASTIVLYVLICKLMDASFFPDAFLMVVVANVLFLFVWFQLLAKAANI